MNSDARVAFVIISLLSLAGSSRAVTLKNEMNDLESKKPCALHATQLLSQISAPGEVSLALNPGLGSREAFHLESTREGVKITGGGAAGIFYGAQEFTNLMKGARKIPSRLRITQKPDFDVRGSTYYLMKDCSYVWPLTPREFPHFYDREMLIRFMDYLAENRFNTLFIWTGHLFPSIMELPDYPEAAELSKEQLRRNQDQFRWLTRECARRNISVLLHFYNIHITKSLADARKIPEFYNKPNAFVTKYYTYCMERFFKEFDSVGLYVCPGEQLEAQYQPQWILDTMIGPAKKSGHNPLIVVRSWSIDRELFIKTCVGQYDNFYTELKHNNEMLVSPVSDARQAEWKKVCKKHIVNLHEVSDLKPFRWGSPLFIRETVEEWKKIGLDGAEVYGLTSWRWPYALDKLEPAQKGFWPEGTKLLTFERDAIWLEAFGRYLWQVNRDPRQEEKYWAKRLGEKFGNQKAGQRLLRWYDVTGPILPGLQNLTSVHNMNGWPTVIASQQGVDRILKARELGKQVPFDPWNLKYPSQPVDSYFFERYKKRFKMPKLTNRISMPVSSYADALAEGREVKDTMTPDKILALMLEMDEEAIALAQKVQAKASVNKDEAARFVTDAQALKLVTQVWEHRVLAAMEKRLYDKTRKTGHKDAFVNHLQAAIKNYEDLVALTDKTYLNATDIGLGTGEFAIKYGHKWSWQKGLEWIKKDVADEMAKLSIEESKQTNRPK